MVKGIHFNQEYLIGFIEGLLAEYDLGLGPFKKHLSGYEIEINLNEASAFNNKEEKDPEIKIHYSIKLFNDQWVAKFNLKSTASKQEFCSFVQQAVEEIIATIKQIRNET